MKAPSLKVDDEYYIAKEINTVLDERDMLISPNLISAWISTMHGHPETGIYRLMVKSRLLKRYMNALEKGNKNKIRVFEEWVSWYDPVDYAYSSNTELSTKIKTLIEKTGSKKLRIFLDYENRLILKGYISGTSKPKDANLFLSEGIDHYAVTAICLPDNNRWKSGIIKVLKSKSFTLTKRLDGFELWTLKS